MQTDKEELRSFENQMTFNYALVLVIGYYLLLEEVGAMESIII